MTKSKSSFEFPFLPVSSVWLCGFGVVVSLFVVESESVLVSVPIYAWLMSFCLLLSVSNKGPYSVLIEHVGKEGWILNKNPYQFYKGLGHWLQLTPEDSALLAFIPLSTCACCVLLPVFMLSIYCRRPLYTLPAFATMTCIHACIPLWARGVEERIIWNYNYALAYVVKAETWENQGK